MLGFLDNESPLRHYIFPAAFALLSVAIIFAYKREKRRAVTRRERALLSVNSDNQPSILVIEANGGRLEDERERE